MNNYEDMICDAISTIVNDAISKANYDRTIQATIVNCEDELTGKYKVKYQNSSFYAYSNSLENRYYKDNAVFVLIPDNDFSNVKTILGSVNKMGEDAINIEEKEADVYRNIGSNIIIGGQQEFELSSYCEYQEDLYNKEKNINKINLDVNLAENYLSASTSFCLGANFRTNLTQEQKAKGNYGIGIEIAFKNENSNKVIKKYLLDINQMTGQPYNFTVNTKQQTYFDLDGSSFEYIDRIYIFNYGFPVQEENEIKDIFINNIELNGTSLIWSDVSESYLLNLKTPNGSTFTIIDDDDYELIIEGDVLYKGRKIQTMIDIVDFYWFVENNVISPANELYNSYGGNGWECLNSYSYENEEIKWLPSTNYLSIKKKDVLCRNRRYKCVGVYEGKEIISEYCYLYNNNPKYQINIESTNGTQFQYNLGYTDLKCKLIGNSAEDEIQYFWSVENKNKILNIEETTNINEELRENIEQYQELIQKIEEEEALKAKEQLNLKRYSDKIDELSSLTRVDASNIYQLLVENLDLVSDYKCTVLINGESIGTSSIRLYNYKEQKYEFGLTIENGEQVFVYDENGVSPCAPTKNTKQTTKILGFSVVDKNGNKLTKEQKDACKITWRVPAQKSLIYISSHTQPTRKNINGYDEYDNLKELSFLINSAYSTDYINNQIELIIKYNDLFLRKFTNFTFVKEGDIGTTGSDVYCLTYPNLSSQEEKNPYLPTLRVDKNGSKWNVKSIYTNNYGLLNFCAELWDKGVKIEDIEPNFELLKTAGLKKAMQEESGFNIYKNNQNTVEYNNNISNEILKSGFMANILKSKIKYKNIEYYNFYPLGFLYFNPELDVSETSLYEVELVENSGFLKCEYNSNGEKPFYSSNNPFEIKVTKMIDGFWEDISTLNKEEYSLSYNWEILGKVYRKNGWESKILLARVEDETLEKNQARFRPADVYSGECVTTALRCKITIDKTGKELCYLHIPIIMNMNRFSNSNINEWDGIGVSINDTGGAILSPQIGAGTKNLQGMFTGMLMGSIKEYLTAEPTQGLFAFKEGERTFKLDAKTGNAIFGTTSSGQIVINPTEDKALIYSNNFWKEYDENDIPISYEKDNENNDGMLIDLSTPRIKWGNENFSIDENGNLKAVNADISGKITATSGYIGGFNLYNQKFELSNSNSIKYHFNDLDLRMFNIYSTSLFSFEKNSVIGLLYDLDFNNKIDENDYQLAIQDKNNVYISNYTFSINPTEPDKLISFNYQLQNQKDLNTPISAGIFSTNIGISGITTPQLKTDTLVCTGSSLDSSVIVNNDGVYSYFDIIDLNTKIYTYQNETGFHIRRRVNEIVNYLIDVGFYGVQLSKTENNITTRTIIEPDGITTPKVTQTSLASIKKNIANISYNRNIFDNSSIYQYNLKSDDDKSNIKYGFVIGEDYNTPLEVLDDDKKGINLYSMCSLMWAEIQNLRKEIKGDK